MHEEGDPRASAVTIQVEWIEHVFAHPIRNLLSAPIWKELIALESLGYQILTRFVPEENGHNRYVGYEIYSYRDEDYGSKGVPNGLVQSVLLFKNGHGRYVKDVKRREYKPRAEKVTENSEHVNPLQENREDGPGRSHDQAPTCRVP